MTTTRRRPAAATQLALVVSGLLLSGCGTSFRPDDAEANSHRAAGDLAAETLLDEVTGGRQLVATALFDQCTEGRHDWKRNDSYDYECDLAHSRVVAGAETVDDVERSLLGLHEEILDAGCTLEYRQGGLKGVAEVYWPARQEMADPSPGMLPSGDYTCIVEGVGELELEVQPYAGTRSEEYDLRTDVMLTPYIPTRTQRSQPFPPATAQLVAASGMALHYVVTATMAYYTV